LIPAGGGSLFSLTKEIPFFDVHGTNNGLKTINQSLTFNFYLRITKFFVPASIDQFINSCLQNLVHGNNEYLGLVSGRHLSPLNNKTFLSFLRYSNLKTPSLASPPA